MSTEVAKQSRCCNQAEVATGEEPCSNNQVSTESSCNCLCNTRGGSVITSSSSSLSRTTRALCQCIHCSCDEFCSCQASEIIALFDAVGYGDLRQIIQEKDDTNPMVQLTTSPPVSSTVPTTTKSIKVSIIGMTCIMCAKTITNALHSVTGVINVQINTSTDTGIITYSPTGILCGKEGVDKILQMIEDVGFDAQLEFAEANATVENDESYDEEQNCYGLSTTDLTSPLLPMGEDEGSSANQQQQYRNRSEQMKARQTQDLRNKKRAFLSSLIGTVPIFFISMVLMYVPISTVQSILKYPIVSGFPLDALLLWLLCTPVQFVCGWVFYKNAYHNIRNGALGMDVLIAIGITASYTYAIILILIGIYTGNDCHGGEFFETSAVLISFVLLGKWLQLLAVRKTGDALTRLMGLAVKKATLVVPRKGWNDSMVDKVFCPEHDVYIELEVDADQLKRGDVVKVIEGSGIPADGVVIYGELTVNESMITGESMPVYKQIDAHVLGGTVCEEGIAFVTLRNVGSETALSKICKLVEEAQMNQAPIQEFADKVSSVFVPVVIFISMSSFIVWYLLAAFTDLIPESWMNGQSPSTFAVMFALPTLVISCPCALGLATPTAVMVGTGVGAAHGVLIKGGEQLELASRIQAVIFDKTGTLTKGKPVITEFVRMDTSCHEEQLSNEELIWMLGSLEKNSNHPLASAIVAYAEKNIGEEKSQFEIPLNFSAITGKGVSGEVRKRLVSIGNRSFAQTSHIQLTNEAENVMAELETAGMTAIIACVNSVILAVIGVSDEIRADSRAAIHYLQKKGIEVWMVTGDNHRTSFAVAQALGLSMENVISEALPATKLEKVKSLQQQGKVVAMVGDGINDSPALAQANVGIALSSGTEIAAETADMILVKGDIGDVCVAIDLAKKIFTRIKINFICALLYNCLCIPIAAGCFYPFVQITLPPVVAAATMALSSISVVLSSLSLRCYEPPSIEMLPPVCSALTILQV